MVIFGCKEYYILVCDVFLIKYYCYAFFINYVFLFNVRLLIFLMFYYVLLFYNIFNIIFIVLFGLNLFDPGRSYCYWDSIKPCKSKEFRFLAYGSVTRG